MIMCRAFYRFKFLYLLFYSTILHALLEIGCSIDYCGRKPNNEVLLYNASDAELGDSPWHVAVYDVKSFNLICGGTIISPNLVISAAHCFYDQDRKQKREANNYEIVIGKLKRDYNSKDSVVQKAYKVKEIRDSPDKPYRPAWWHHASDIAAVVLAEPMKFNELVLPACIDWTGRPPFRPTKKMHSGELVGWGKYKKESDQPSDTLRAADLPFISYTDCQKKMEILEFDKFCAGTDDGVGSAMGDSGGGLVFRSEDNRFYLRGIVSTREKYSNLSISSFTDLTYHVEWLDRVHTEISNKEEISLLQAAEQGQLDKVKYFLREKREDINSRDSFNNTVLHLAASHNHQNILEYLIEEEKADTNTRGFVGRTPLHMATATGHLQLVQYLILKKANPDLKDNENSSVLHLAAASGHIHVIRYLADELGVDVNIKGYAGRTPLCYAALNNKLNTIKYLIQKKANPNQRDNQNRSVLHLAALGGHENVVGYLIDQAGIDVNIKGYGRGTPLHAAAQYGQLYTVKYLIQKKANPNLKNDADDLALHNAAYRGYIDVVKYFINEIGVDMNAKGNLGRTALHIASLNGHLNIVKYMIENKKASISSKDNQNSSVLHLAALDGHINVVGYLIDEAGIDVNTKGYIGRTPLYYAAQYGQLDTVKYLIQKKANPNLKDDTDDLALTEAAYRGYIDVVKYFIDEIGVDMNAKGFAGRTPFHMASLNGHLNIVKYMLENKKASISSKDNENSLVLHLAAWNGHINVVGYLIDEAGIDVNTKGYIGKTPLHYAAQYGQLDMVKYLIQKKANPNLKDDLNNLALHYAAYRGYIDEVKYFIDEIGVDMNAKGDLGRTPFHMASLSGHFNIVKYMVEDKKANISSTDNENNTAVYLAARNGHRNVVTYLSRVPVVGRL